LTFLLDTNAISEPGRTQPNRGFTDWFDAAPEAELFLSVVTLGELRRGAALLPPSARRADLEATHQAILRQFELQVIPVDRTVALAWGELTARHWRAGRRPSMSDELIAATALVHDLIVVTRNVADFEAAGCKLLSPWSS
jgi:predicted nucleic acid-binding protein